MKVLINGVAGFFGSNILRHLLFTTKDLNIVGVDYMSNIDREKLRIYHHRKHNFCLCDATNEESFSQLLELEKPDVIIDCVVSQYKADYKNFLTNVTVGMTKSIPVISLLWEHSIFKNAMKEIAFPDIRMIEIPTCFGFRENVSVGVAKIIKESIEDDWNFNKSVVDKDWMYIEELSDYVLKQLKSLEMMPQFKKINGYGFTSELSIANFCTKYLKEGKGRLKFEKNEGVESVLNFQESLEKTIEWYKSNQWALNIK